MEHRPLPNKPLPIRLVRHYDVKWDDAFWHVLEPGSDWPKMNDGELEFTHEELSKIFRLRLLVVRRQLERMEKQDSSKP